MRADLARHGVDEARTPQDVDRLISPENGTVLMIVNSVCGCAAGRARPAIGMALKHPVRPEKAGTVFAGGDEAAVAHLREILAPYPPFSLSSSQESFFRKVVVSSKKVSRTCRTSSGRAACSSARFINSSHRSRATCPIANGACRIRSLGWPRCSMYEGGPPNR